MRELWEFLQSVGNHWVGFLTGGVLMAIGSLYEHLEEKQIPPGLFIYGGIAFLFLSFFLAWRDEHRRCVALEAETMTVKVDIIVEDSHARPYKHEWKTGGDHNALFRVAVKNISSIPLDGVVIKIDSIEPCPDEIDYLPATLRLMNTDPTVRQFSLRAGEKRFVDVIQQSDNLTNTTVLCLWHTVPGRSELIPLQEYKLQLAAYAERSQPCQKMASVRLVDNSLQFALLEEQPS